MRLNTSHKHIKVEGEDKIDVIIGPIMIKPEIGHIIGICIHLIEAGKIMTEILDQAIGGDLEITTDGKNTDRVVGMTIHGKITEETTIGIIIGKIMVKVITENKGIEVQVGTVTEITTETNQEKDMTKVEIQVGMEEERDIQGQGLGWNQKVEGILIDQEQNQGPDHVQGSAQIEIGLDVIGAESMITLQESVPMLSQVRTQMVQNKPPYVDSGQQN